MSACAQLHSQHLPAILGEQLPGSSLPAPTMWHEHRRCGFWSEAHVLDPEDGEPVGEPARQWGGQSSN